MRKLFLPTISSVTNVCLVNIVSRTYSARLARERDEQVLEPK